MLSVAPRKYFFQIYDRHANPIGSYHAMDLPLQREAIIMKSVHYYNDPSPGYVRIGNVSIRMLAELCDYLRPHSRPVSLSEMPNELSSYLNLDTDVDYISLISGDME